MANDLTMTFYKRLKEQPVFIINIINFVVCDCHNFYG